MELNTSPGEIDLLGVAARAYRTLQRNKVATILFPIFGLIGGVMVSTFSHDSTRASMMIETSLISENEFQFLMEQLNQADSITGLTREQQRKISGIEYEVKKGDTHRENFKDITHLYLKINTVIADKTILPILQKALLNYLNQSEPIARNRTQRQEYYNRMVHQIDVELTGLKAVERQINDKAKATYLDPSDLFAKSVELYDQRVKYEIALADIKSVHVVKGFGSLTKSARWSRTLYSAIGFIAGVVALFVFLFLRFFHRYSLNLEKNK